MRWFKHDSDANMDAKLQEVLLDYGLEGYGLYWYCIELITSKLDKDNLTFELEHDARIIARNTGSTVQRVEEMMRRFVELGLFDNNNGNIRCLKLLKRLDSSMTNSPQMRSFISEAKERHDTVMTPPDNVMLEENRTEENRINNMSSTDDHPTEPDIAQEVLDIYHQIITDHQPNWRKCLTFDHQRKQLCRKALNAVKPRAKAKGMEPLDVLTNLLTAMACDPFYSGKPNPRNPEGFRCTIETNLRPKRLKDAIDSLAEE